LEQTRRELSRLGGDNNDLRARVTRLEKLKDEAKREATETFEEMTAALTARDEEVTAALARARQLERELAARDEADAQRARSEARAATREGWTPQREANVARLLADRERVYSQRLVEIAKADANQMILALAARVETLQARLTEAWTSATNAEPEPEPVEPTEAGDALDSEMLVFEVDRSAARLAERFAGATSRQRRPGDPDESK
jgi:cell division septum initiation protein DivIVA